MNFAPFVLRCPECAAPSEELAVRCRYCDVPLSWRPIVSLGALQAYEPPVQLIEPGITLGFGPAPVQPHATQTHNMMPQINVQPYRIVLHPSCAEHVMVNDVRIGKNSQFANSAPIPGIAFSERALGVAMSLDALYVGMLMSIEITNISKRVIDVSGFVGCHTPGDRGGRELERLNVVELRTRR